MRPPAPTPLPSILALLRALITRDHNLLGLLPESAYRVGIGPLGYSRRSIVLVNDPALVRQVMTEGALSFPKSDLMVGALDPLVGQSIFTSGGATWQRQRAMIDPAFTHMRVNRAFGAMRDAWETNAAALDRAARSNEPVCLDLVMSQLTADIICRTVFSIALTSDKAREVFEAFTVFERSVAQVRLHRLILAPAFAPVRQTAEVLQACQRIRHLLNDLIESHAAAGGEAADDIAGELLRARSAEDAQGFSRNELIDQLGVMFLAGHETTASALTWAMVLLAQTPALVVRLRTEVRAACHDQPVQHEHLKAMPLVRAVFREALRLYPPLTFMPRVAMQECALGHYAVRRGALIMVSPWTMHRHREYWQQPDAFDPDRFMPGREESLTPGAYLPFGLGPRVCVGAAFAMTESSLILAEWVRRYDWTIIKPDPIRPAARLTTRPALPVWLQLRRHE